MPKFEVWRNPQPVKASPRKQRLDKSIDHALYILQEFVEDGCLGYWTRVCDFEVLSGGRAA